MVNNWSAPVRLSLWHEGRVEEFRSESKSRGFHSLSIRVVAAYTRCGTAEMGTTPVVVLGDVVGFGVVLLCLYLVVLYYCQKSVALRRWLPLLFLMAIVWCLCGVTRKLYVDEFLPPIDARGHELAARKVAVELNEGKFDEVLAGLTPGNRAYQVALGGFYWLTGASELVTYLINGGLACWGLVALLYVMVRASGCQMLPFWVVVLVGFLPSGICWSTTNLKEGPMLWAICMILQAAANPGSGSSQSQLGPTVMGDRSRRSSLISFFLGAIVASILRPHIAIAWVAGIMAGVGLWERRIKTTVAGGLGLVLGVILLNYLAPEMMAQLVEGDVLEELQESYESRAHLGASAISYGGEGPIPILSGLTLIFLRPYPTEIHNAVAFFAALEIWILSCLALIGWLLLRRRSEALTTPFVITLMVTTLIIAFLFTYMYNMGLLVRQRLQVLPAVVGLAVFPYLIRTGVRQGLVRVGWASVGYGATQQQDD